MTLTEPREVELRWRASSLTKAIASCAGVALAAAVLGRWQLVAFAAPLLGVLCSISWQRPSAKVHVHGRPGLTRCFETDETQLRVWVTTDAPTVAAEVTVSVESGMEVDALEGSAASLKTVAVRAERWGRYPITARVDAVAGGGLLAGTGTVEPAEVFVFPLPRRNRRRYRASNCPTGSAHTSPVTSDRASNTRTSVPTFPVTSCAPSTGR